MFRILILYATTEGHATRIAERVAQRLRDKGHVVVESHQANAIPANLNPSACDGIIVGASIHYVITRLIFARWFNDTARA